MSAQQRHVLQPVNITLPLLNAEGDVVPNGAPGVVFSFEVLPFASEQFAVRQLSVGESAAWGIQLTVLTPGSVRVNMRASVGTAGQNSMAASVDISCTGTASYRQATSLTVS